MPVAGFVVRASERVGVLDRYLGQQDRRAGAPLHGVPGVHADRRRRPLGERNASDELQRMLVFCAAALPRALCSVGAPAAVCCSGLLPQSCLSAL